MYVCMYVCMYICMYVYMYVCKQLEFSSYDLLYHIVSSFHSVSNLLIGDFSVSFYIQ